MRSWRLYFGRERCTEYFRAGSSSVLSLPIGLVMVIAVAVLPLVLSGVGGGVLSPVTGVAVSTVFGSMVLGSSAWVAVLSLLPVGSEGLSSMIFPISFSTSANSVDRSAFCFEKGELEAPSTWSLSVSAFRSSDETRSGRGRRSTASLSGGRIPVKDACLGGGFADGSREHVTSCE